MLIVPAATIAISSARLIPSLAASSAETNVQDPDTGSRLASVRREAIQAVSSESTLALLMAKATYPQMRIDLVLPIPKHDDNALCVNAQRNSYRVYVPAGINVHEYNNYFNHLEIAAFDDHRVIRSANLNFRSLENDRDFEVVVVIRGAAFADRINAEVRDTDIRYSRQILLSDLRGPGSGAFNDLQVPTSLLRPAREL